MIKDSPAQQNITPAYKKASPVMIKGSAIEL